jgi:hypothetical protein
MPRRPSLLARCCAAWIILLALSPFTAPFAVCQAGDLVAADTGSTGHRPSTNDLGIWWNDGGVVADLPMTPMAEAVKELSASNVHHAAESLNRPHPTIAPGHPGPPLRRSCSTLLVVLRV